MLDLGIWAGRDVKFARWCAVTIVVAAVRPPVASAVDAHLIYPLRTDANGDRVELRIIARNAPAWKEGEFSIELWRTGPDGGPPRAHAEDSRGVVRQERWPEGHVHDWESRVCPEDAINLFLGFRRASDPATYGHNYRVTSERDPAGNYLFRVPQAPGTVRLPLMGRDRMLVADAGYAVGVYDLGGTKQHRTGTVVGPDGEIYMLVSRQVADEVGSEGLTYLARLSSEEIIPLANHYIDDLKFSVADGRLRVAGVAATLDLRDVKGKFRREERSVRQRLEWNSYSGYAYFSLSPGTVEATRGAADQFAELFLKRDLAFVGHPGQLFNRASAERLRDLDGRLRGIQARLAREQSERRDRMAGSGSLAEKLPADVSDVFFARLDELGIAYDRRAPQKWFRERIDAGPLEQWNRLSGRDKIRWARDYRAYLEYVAALLGPAAPDDAGRLSALAREISAATPRAAWLTIGNRSYGALAKLMARAFATAAEIDGRENFTTDPRSSMFLAEGVRALIDWPDVFSPETREFLQATGFGAPDELIPFLPKLAELGAVIRLHSEVVGKEMVFRLDIRLRDSGEVLADRAFRLPLRTAAVDPRLEILKQAPQYRLSFLTEMRQAFASPAWTEQVQALHETRRPAVHCADALALAGTAALEELAVSTR